MRKRRLLVQKAREQSALVAAIVGVLLLAAATMTLFFRLGGAHDEMRRALLAQGFRCGDFSKLDTARANWTGLKFTRSGGRSIFISRATVTASSGRHTVYVRLERTEDVWAVRGVSDARGRTLCRL